MSAIMAENRTFAEIKLGDSATVSHGLSKAELEGFAAVSGDFNPIHLDEEFAKTTRFGKRIAHGMLSGAFISAVLGYELSERKILYLSQTMKFTAPVFIGDTVTSTATVTNIRKDRAIVTLWTDCTNQRDETVVTGEAVVMILPA